MGNRLRHITYVLLGISSLVGPAGAMEGCSAEGKASDGKPYHIALSSDWTDKKIFHALGLDIRKTKLIVSRGPDGVARDYLLGKKSLRIVRSESTGLYVMLSVSGGDAYEWYLSDCHFEASKRKGVDG